MGQHWLDGRQNLKPAVAIEIPAMGEQGPQGASFTHAASFGVFLGHIRIEKVENARALALQWIGMDAIVLVERPEIEIALHGIVVRLSEERPDATRRLAFTAGEHDERPGRIHFAILAGPVVDHSEERPEDSG